MKYRKKPVEADAFKWTGDIYQEEDPVWIVDAIERGDVRIICAGSPVSCMVIKTLEGEAAAKLGDYIIRGAAGEIYPCKPEIFEATYERI